MSCQPERNLLPSTKSLYVQAGLSMPDSLDPSMHPYGLYLVSCINWGVAKRRDHLGWVALKGDYLRRAIPEACFPRVRDALVRSGVIQWDKRYVVGRHSQRYRIGDDWYGRDVHRIPCPCPVFSSKLRRIEGKDARVPTGLVYRWLSDQLGRLQVDMEAVRSICDKLGKPELAMVASGLADRDSYFSVCPYGRLHTLVTCLKRELRPCLSVSLPSGSSPSSPSGSSSLVNIDIVNSQPLFLAALMLRQRRQDGREKGKGGKKRATTIPNYLHLLGRQGLEESQKEYLTLCEQGKVYERLMELWGVGRARAKKLFFKLAFGKIKKNSRSRRRFEKAFPSVLACMDASKRKDYRDLARQLQKDESRLVINGVCDSLRRIDPLMPVYTIHDSILTTREYVDVVQAVMLEEFERIGIRPSLKVEG